ncbi:MAG: TIGR02147 family protein [Deltaproteobacteria bacterium]|nr:TIGR02147 family protein [Deltaproteobacteria bacterium]
MKTIYAYSNYREFLKDMVQELKNSQPSFSYRYFAKKAGYTSPNFLKLVIDGKRNLSEESIRKFAEVFKLGKKEKRFFELLVHYNQTIHPERRQQYYQEILDFAEYRSAHELEKEQYEYLSHWYYPAILELSHLSSFQENPEWIAGQLQNKISNKEVLAAIDCLSRIGLLVRDENGKLKPAHKALTTGEEARSLAAFSYHEQLLEMANQALKQKAEEREFAAMTMAVSEAEMKKLKEMIHDFRKKVVNVLTQGGAEPNSVYQLNMQLFSLTKKGNGE